MDILILDFCDSILNSWGDLSASERSDVYKTSTVSEWSMKTWNPEI